jgi:hypothetical protein
LVQIVAIKEYGGHGLPRLEVVQPSSVGKTGLTAHTVSK